MPHKKLKGAPRKNAKPMARSVFKKGGAKKSGKNWIQKAIKKPGALRATAKRAGALKADHYFFFILPREKAKGKGKTAQRARLALTLGKMKKK